MRGSSEFPATSKIAAGLASVTDALLAGLASVADALLGGSIRYSIIRCFVFIAMRKVAPAAAPTWKSFSSSNTSP